MITTTKLPKSSGIYMIENKINHKKYIGKTISFYKRYHTYKTAFKLQSIKKINQRFLNSMNKYGIENFEFFIIEYCDVSLLSERELYWMNYYEVTNPEKGYNLRMDSSTKMITHDDTRKKISERLKKEWSAGIRDNHSKKLTDNWKDNSYRKLNQSILFSKTKTKYSYKLSDSNSNFIRIIDYKELKELGLKNCLATFFQKKCNIIKFKEFIIERILI